MLFRIHFVLYAPVKFYIHCGLGVGRGLREGVTVRHHFLRIVQKVKLLLLEGCEVVCGFELHFPFHYLGAVVVFDGLFCFHLLLELFHFILTIIKCKSIMIL